SESSVIAPSIRENEVERKRIHSPNASIGLSSQEKTKLAAKGFAASLRRIESVERQPKSGKRRNLNQMIVGFNLPVRQPPHAEQLDQNIALLGRDAQFLDILSGGRPLLGGGLKERLGFFFQRGNLYGEFFDGLL